MCGEDMVCAVRGGRFGDGEFDVGEGGIEEGEEEREREGEEVHAGS